VIEIENVIAFIDDIIVEIKTNKGYNNIVEEILC